MLSVGIKGDRRIGENVMLTEPRLMKTVKLPRFNLNNPQFHGLNFLAFGRVRPRLVWY
jgi:hypothetical protein